MFTSDNFYNRGVEYDYDALNNILNSYLSESNDADGQNVKNYSDMINDALFERDGNIYHGESIVGVVVSCE